MAHERLAIDQIEASAGTQIRVKIDDAVVKEYAEAIGAGAIFPPIVVFAPKNSQRYILADGFHRLAAVKLLEKQTIGVEVKEGGTHEALSFALSANAAHGLRRSNADKRNAVMMALKDPNYDDWSLRQIGDLCHVSKDLVASIKSDLNKGEDEKTVKPRPRKEPPTQEQLDRKEFLGALATIKSFPYSGRLAWDKLQLMGDMDDVEFVYGWLGEVIDEHKAQENS